MYTGGVYVIKLLCFSPIHLPFITGELQPKTWKGKGEIIFLPTQWYIVIYRIVLIVLKSIFNFLLFCS